MKCPYKENFYCPFVNTLHMTKEQDCNTCKHNQKEDKDKLYEKM